MCRLNFLAYDGKHKKLTRMTIINMLTDVVVIVVVVGILESRACPTIIKKNRASLLVHIFRFVF